MSKMSKKMSKNFRNILCKYLFFFILKDYGRYKWWSRSCRVGRVDDDDDDCGGGGGGGGGDCDLLTLKKPITITPIHSNACNCTLSIIVN